MYKYAKVDDIEKAIRNRISYARGNSVQDISVRNECLEAVSDVDCIMLPVDETISSLDSMIEMGEHLNSKYGNEGFKPVDIEYLQRQKFFLKRLTKNNE